MTNFLPSCTRKYAASCLEVVPERGGLVSRLVLDGVEVLYLDPDTLHDRTRSVRGGIPVLFPLCGPLPEGRYALGAQVYDMPRHGFARDLAWQVVNADEDTPLVLKLRASEATRSCYPFDFALELVFHLASRSLRTEVLVCNEGAGRMPFGLGFHPYFQVQQRSLARLALQAATMRRNPGGTPRPAWTQVDLTKSDLDDAYAGLGAVRAELTDPVAGTRVALTGGTEFAELVVWTQQNEGFVCVEPWTARGHAMAECMGVEWLNPGASWRSWYEIELLEGGRSA